MSGIVDLLKPELIRLHVHAENWEEAVVRSTEPFLEQNVCTKDYVDDIIRGVREYGPYIVIAKHTALPHARSECGALKTALGITVLENPVCFGNEDNDPVKYLFPLSAVDGTQHMEALADLVELLGDERFYRVLDEASSEKQLYEDIVLWRGKRE